MKNKYFFLLIAISLMFLLTREVSADRRAYVWTYEAITMPKGEHEFEYYFTLNWPEIDDKKTSSWEHQFELEFGITEKWDISFYQVFKQESEKNGGGFKYDTFKLRTRYRPFDYGEKFVDVVLYTEYKLKVKKLENKLENKLIVSKKDRKRDLSFNAIYEIGENSKPEYGYAAGISYEIAPLLKVGVETRGKFKSDKDTFSYSIGPTISYGKSNKFFNMGFQFGLNKHSNDLDMRMLIGIGF